MPSAKKIMLALAIFTMATALPTPQLAGEGQAADSIFTDTDNGVGHGIENAENNLAATISSIKGGTPLPATPRRRQLDKISNGAQNVANAAGVGSSTSALTGALDNIDGASTSGAANLGADVGGMEDSTLESAGNAVPRL
ncbi:hypothetical protein yc1106_01279 [Curvularia clavata]|uniref:Uncharacterized protein n=1 Tax=Curvularia clavata TaxID=95742 RepID=A0A9Q9DPC0_CURCL|nr:hypothetical protein yc1106_01279 [Curvularia clavata]